MSINEEDLVEVDGNTVIEGAVVDPQSAIRDGRRVIGDVIDQFDVTIEGDKIVFEDLISVTEIEFFGPPSVPDSEKIEYNILTEPKFPLLLSEVPRADKIERLEYNINRMSALGNISLEDLKIIVREEI